MRQDFSHTCCTMCARCMTLAGHEGKAMEDTVRRHQSTAQGEISPPDTDHAGTLTLDLKPPELGENKFLWFQSPVYGFLSWWHKLRPHSQPQLIPGEAATTFDELGLR